MGHRSPMLYQNRTETGGTSRNKAAPAFWKILWKLPGKTSYAMGYFCTQKWRLGNCKLVRSLFLSLAFSADLITAKSFQFHRRENFLGCCKGAAICRGASTEECAIMFYARFCTVKASRGRPATEDAGLNLPTSPLE